MNRPAPKHLPMLWLLVCAVALLVGFSAVFEIDQGVRTQGQFIAGARTQVVQAVDGGMLVALHVREGDAVKAGQKLAEFEPDRAQAGYTQSVAEMASKNLALIRVRGELSGSAPVYSPAQTKTWGSYTDAQLGIYRQRKLSLDQELDVLQGSLVLAREELKMSQNLFDGGDISRSEVMRAERQVLDVQSRINAARNKYLSDARIELARLEDERTASVQKLNERQNVLEHTDMTSPMNGVVKVVRITTVGGVLKPGDELMQISPADDELLLEIKVNPADVGQLSLGLPASLRIDAFDSSIFGKLNGTLRYISPDTLSEPGANGQNQTFYRAQVAVDWSTSAPNQRIRAQDIKPGMTATADVLTGQRSILNYLLKPITRAFSGALMQR